MRKTLLFGASIAALAIVGPVLAAPIPTGSATEDKSEATDCTGEGNSLIAMHPTLLWPPNHKYFGDQAGENLYFLAEGDDGEEIVLVTTGSHDQYDSEGEELKGSGSTADEDGDGFADDVTPDESGPLSGDSANEPAYAEEGEASVQTDWMARAERAGTGVKAGVPNRTYTLTGRATFDDGGSCTLSIEIVVPHDMGKGTGNGKKAPVR